jgi:hypothetical protein
MPTPQPIAPDGDPPGNPAAAKAPPQQDEAEDVETTGTEDALPESSPSQ